MNHRYPETSVIEGSDRFWGGEGKPLPKHK